ncbi:hypothetical protein BCR33DRAFT_740435 [Rhizoclosmatium globosum]|uniref:Uncharacterized protein n=1 Tax=Rhizoclosmatium globosum TaxID=329046 RepID=A0A1Y2BZH1_9FUNG|nr:hypothetical protein BCR33DRAFT_740435 [Rhizoclosmatium globosum]|eukprot:ORY40159.1 hypothetical protein BCR33DRAFT_740435 [Rhizoclosmatium globosum]
MILNQTTPINQIYGFDEVIPEGQKLQLVDKDGKVITKDIKLGLLTAPTLVKHTVYSVVLKSLPECTSKSALAGRLLPVRTALETEIQTVLDLIDKLTEVILFMELNSDGGKTEEEKAKKALRKPNNIVKLTQRRTSRRRKTQRSKSTSVHCVQR